VRRRKPPPRVKLPGLPTCLGCDRCGVMYGPFPEGPDGLSRNHDGRERFFLWNGAAYVCSECYRGRRRPA
jgi:hypothetical protein